MISVLVKKHANLAARTPVGNVPLHYAAQGNHSGAAAMIVALMREQNLLAPSSEAYKAFRNVCADELTGLGFASPRLASPRPASPRLS